MKIFSDTIFDIVDEDEIPVKYRKHDMKVLVSMMWLARLSLKQVIVAMFSDKVTSYMCTLPTWLVRVLGILGTRRTGTEVDTGLQT